MPTPTPTFDQATNDLIGSLDAAAHAHYVKSLTYTEARLQAAQNAVSPAYWKKYELVSVGSGAGDYVDVGSSTTSLEGPGGRVGRDRLAVILTRALEVRVIVTYCLPAQAVNG